MIRTLTKGCCFLVLVAVLSTVTIFAFAPDIRPDRFTLRRMFPFDTQYSDDFSFEAFKQVSIGMHKDEVRNLIGEPIRRLPWRSHGERPMDRWFYSISPQYTEHWATMVMFDAETCEVVKIDTSLVW